MLMNLMSSICCTLPAPDSLRLDKAILMDCGVRVTHSQNVPDNWVEDNLLCTYSILEYSTSWWIYLYNARQHWLFKYICIMLPEVSFGSISYTEHSKKMWPLPSIVRCLDHHSCGCWRLYMEKTMTAIHHGVRALCAAWLPFRKAVSREQLHRAIPYFSLAGGFLCSAESPSQHKTLLSPYPDLFPPHCKTSSYSDIN